MASPIQVSVVAPGGPGDPLQAAIRAAVAAPVEERPGDGSTDATGNVGDVHLSIPGQEKRRNSKKHKRSKSRDKGHQRAHSKSRDDRKSRKESGRGSVQPSGRRSSALPKDRRESARPSGRRSSARPSSGSGIRRHTTRGHRRKGSGHDSGGKRLHKQSSADRYRRPSHNPKAAHWGAGDAAKRDPNRRPSSRSNAGAERVPDNGGKQLQLAPRSSSMEDGMPRRERAKSRFQQKVIRENWSPGDVVYQTGARGCSFALMLVATSLFITGVGLYIWWRQNDFMLGLPFFVGALYPLVLITRRWVTSYEVRQYALVVRTCMGTDTIPGDVIQHMEFGASNANACMNEASIRSLSCNEDERLAMRVLNYEDPRAGDCCHGPCTPTQMFVLSASDNEQFLVELESMQDRCTETPSYV